MNSYIYVWKISIKVEKWIKKNIKTKIGPWSELRLNQFFIILSFITKADPSRLPYH
jgi:hypothetical protein